jgi:hypothetical protein
MVAHPVSSDALHGLRGAIRERDAREAALARVKRAHLTRIEAEISSVLAAHGSDSTQPIIRSQRRRNDRVTHHGRVLIGPTLWRFTAVEQCGTSSTKIVELRIKAGRFADSVTLI